MKLYRKIGLILLTLIASCNYLTADQDSEKGNTDVFISNATVVDKKVFITIAITNTGSQISYIDKLNFPRNGNLKNDLFSISKIGATGVSMQYLGTLYNRGHVLTEKHFFILKPKETKTIEVNLSEYYNFIDLSGEYSVVFKVKNQVLGTPEKYELLESNYSQFKF
jgi:archaellum component FlaF (FlaF/FlaG flagellin family)